MGKGKKPKKRKRTSPTDRKIQKKPKLVFSTRAFVQGELMKKIATKFFGGNSEVQDHRFNKNVLFRHADIIISNVKVIIIPYASGRSIRYTKVPKTTDDVTAEDFLKTFLKREIAKYDEERLFNDEAVLQSIEAGKTLHSFLGTGNTNVPRNATEQEKLEKAYKEFQDRTMGTRHTKSIGPKILFSEDHLDDPKNLHEIQRISQRTNGPHLMFNQQQLQPLQSEDGLIQIPVINEVPRSPIREEIIIIDEKPREQVFTKQEQFGKDFPPAVNEAVIECLRSFLSSLKDVAFSFGTKAAKNKLVKEMLNSHVLTIVSNVREGKNGITDYKVSIGIIKSRIRELLEEEKKTKAYTAACVMGLETISNRLNGFKETLEKMVQEEFSICHFDKKDGSLKKFFKTIFI